MSKFLRVRIVFAAALGALFAVAKFVGIVRALMDEADVHEPVWFVKQFVYLALFVFMAAWFWNRHREISAAAG